MKYDVISPDGIPIAARGYYPSKQSAIAALEQWKSRFDQQGYYSTIRGGHRVHIPLDELRKYCKIIKVK